MPRLIVDASFAVKWFVLEDHSDRALPLLDTDTVLVSPDIVRIEVASALSRRVREGGLVFIEASNGITALSRYSAEFPPSEALLQEALSISVALKHPLYDCVYLAAAKSRQMTVLAADQKFAEKVSGTPYSTDVVLLSSREE